MLAGILAGLTWGLETFILGLALVKSQFCDTAQAIFLAPFVSTFIHDTISAICACIYNGVRGNLPALGRALKTKSGKWVAVAAVLGGPVGMTGYVMAVNYMSASTGSIASAIFPAIGAVLAYIFLKEKLQWYRWVFLILTLLGVYGLYYSPEEVHIISYGLGILGAVLCSFGWGLETVILAKCLQEEDTEVTDELALQIRQTTSALTYGVVLLPAISLIKGWNITAAWQFAGSLFQNSGTLIPLIAAAGVSATVSYLFYYRSISQIGAAKPMALNVTYGAWTIIFTVIFLRDLSVLNPITICCGLAVLVFSILTAADYKELFKKGDKEEAVAEPVAEEA